MMVLRCATNDGIKIFRLVHSFLFAEKVIKVYVKKYINQHIYHYALICLISALSFHEITTQIPHQVDIAIPLRARKPHIDYPPIQVFWYSEKNFQAGIETHIIDGTQILIYSVEKTVADCFKYRNKESIRINLTILMSRDVYGF